MRGANFDMHKIRRTFLLLTIITMLISLPSFDFGIMVSADTTSKSTIIDDKDAESIDSAKKPTDGAQKAGDTFNDNKTISDTIDTNGIPNTTVSNAYVDNNSNTDYHLIDSKLPKIKPVWGNYARVHNMNVPSQISSIDSINTGAVTFKTKWFLPTGFHVSQGEHGNYQSAFIANNNFYFVESAGTGTDKGAVVKIGLDALDKLGINANDQRSLLAKVFNFFNNNSTYGKDNNKNLSDYIVKTDPYRRSNNNLNAKIDKAKKAMDASNTKIKNGQKAFNKATKKIRTKLNKAIKANRKTANRLKKKHFKSMPTIRKIAKLGKAYKKLNAKRKNMSKLSPKAFKTFNRVKKAQNKLINKDKKQIKGWNAKVKDNNRKINEISQRNDLFSKYFELSKLLTVSPVTNIGHGQTLAYNPSNDHVYLAQDDKLGSSTTNFYNQVTEMDPDTMKPIHIYRFKLNNKGHYYALHTLTFDNQGNAYFGIAGGPKNINGAYTLFHGTLSDSKIEFSPVKGLIKWAGSYNQGVTYNRNNDRIYLLSNDMIISIPAAEVRNDNIQPQDVRYTTFASKREFESLSFDSNGYGYLVTLWRSELMKSTTPID